MSTKPRLLVTGATGLLGSALVRAGLDRYEVWGLARHPEAVPLRCSPIQADITDEVAVAGIVEAVDPHVVIHAAALASVNQCQADPEQAYRVNVQGTKNLLRALNGQECKFVFISTDSVFDGAKGDYTESDSPAPLHVYGRTKHQAEGVVLAARPDALVVRTAFYGWNVLPQESLSEWILHLLRGRRQVQGFTDVWFTPLLTDHLVGLLYHLLSASTSGILHLGSRESVSKYEFAQRLAVEFGFPTDLVVATTIEAAQLGAPRPKNVSLSTARAVTVLGRPLPSVVDGLRQFRAAETAVDHAISAKSHASSRAGMRDLARDKFLPYGKHEVDDGDVVAVVEALRGDLITQGRKIEEFEHAVAAYCGAAHAVAFSSGTAALHAACKAAGLGPGDEAITTPLTFAATATAPVYCGAVPRFADIQPDTLNIDPTRIEEQITERTRVILPVDFAGQPADLDRILAIARRHRLIVVEDAAHALGARFGRSRIGALADMTVFSFHPVKHITTGEGGMVLTNDGTFAERLRVFRHHGIVKDEQHPWQYEIIELGHNYRLTDFQCALGVSQLRKLDWRLARLKELAGCYRRMLAGVEGVSLPALRPDRDHAWHLFVVLLQLDALTVDRDAVIGLLRSEEIGATVHYPLVHLHPFFRRQFGYGPGLCPVAESLVTRLVSLPLFATMTEGDVNRVVAALVRILALTQKRSPGLRMVGSS